MSQAPSDLPSLPEQIVIFLQSPLHHAVLSPARFFGSFTRIGWPLSFTTLRRQAACLAPAHARGKAHLEIGLIFQALAFQFGDKPLHYFLNRHRTLLQRAFLLVPRRNVSVVLLFRVLSP